jgi:tripartite-type tricarboxylate transporter receptor subunit TctC
MSVRCNLLQLGLLCLLAAPASTEALAESYPAGPVKFIAPMAAGGGSEPAMRIIINELGRMWGQQTVMVNQPGAGGAIAARTAAAATPDGHTLYLPIASTFTTLPAMQPNLPFKIDDFVPIGFAGEMPFGIAVSPGLAVSSLSELVALSKRQPGGFSVAMGIRGGATHLATELFRLRSGADLTSVFYPGAAQALGDVISGRVSALVDGSAITAPQLKLLATTGTARLASRPDVPTVSEALPGFAASGWFVMMAPPGTPASIVTKVSHDLHFVLAQSELKERLAALAVSSRPMSPSQLADFIRSEQQLWMPVIKQIGLATQ